MKNNLILKISLCFVLVLAGIYTVLTVYAPSSAGIIGQSYYMSILLPFFGHAAKLFGLFLVLCAGFVWIFKKPHVKILGLMFSTLPILIWVDNYFITDVFPAQSQIGRVANSAITVYLGKTGLWLIEIVSLVIGLFLLSPGTLSKRSAPVESEEEGEEQEELEEEDKTIEEEPLKSKSVKKEPSTTKKKEESKSEKEVSQSKTKPPKKTPFSRNSSIALDLRPVKKKYSRPQISELMEQPEDSISYGSKKNMIKDVFSSLGVDIEIGQITGGPSVEQYEIIPGKGVKLAQIKKLDDDLSLALKSKALITFNSRGSLCAEIPIPKRRTVFFRRLLETAPKNKFKLPVVLGANASYETHCFDLAELPHLLIAGTTGSGKSILVKTILASIMYNLTPNDVRLVLIDPKRVDFSIFNASSFLACKVVTDMADASRLLEILVEEMERRYDVLEKSNSANISQFNENASPDKRIPYIVAIIDEFADLIMAEKNDIGDNIIRIAQKARACGIHLILATQRPSAEVISGLIKANVPGKIALSVSSSINSKIIIDRSGAEKLLGKGDMIFISPEQKDGVRLQGAYISDDEIMKFM
ncbi:DUF87 domain-containing protein [bacterium]|nr:DUF87 domain-containing protein [bacterium]